MTELENTNRPSLKKRTNQYQSSRLYLRHKDHRDIVLNEEYQNAMCFSQDDDNNVLDFVKWRKYKPHLLLGYISTNYGALVSVDVKNKIVHHTERLNGWLFVVTLKDYIVCFTTLSSGLGKILCVSKNGYDWKQVNNITYREYVQFGDTNSLAYIVRNGNTLTAYKVTVQDNEETGDIEFVENGMIATKTFVQTPETAGYSALDSYRVYGRSRNGFIVRAGNYLDAPLWDITENGFEFLMNAGWNDYRAGFVQNTNRYSAYGDGIAIIPTFKLVERSGLEPLLQALAIVCKDGEATAVVVGGYTGGTDGWTASGCYFDVIHKNGKFWYYFMQRQITWDSYGNRTYHYRLRIFSSEDGFEWEEISLPDYVDVNIVETSYRYSNTVENPYKKVRLVLNRDASIPTDSDTINVSYDGLTNKGGDICQHGLNFCISLVDNEWTDREQGICISTSNGYYIVFKNMDFSESEDNFAFSSNVQVEYAEPVQKGDYCNPSVLVEDLV